MTCRYENLARETAARITELHDRAARWEKHPTLHTRVPGVRAQIASLEHTLAKQASTARWAKELRAARGYA